MRLYPILLAASLILAGPTLAAVRPTPGFADARIRTVPYDPNQVIELPATVGYEMTIEFGEGEKLENVSIGDSLAWQLTPNKRANLLFVKPLSPRAHTNMTVITNLRRYNFALVSRAETRRDPNLIFGLRFDYPAPAFVPPPPPPPPHQPPQDINHAYSFSGAAEGLPTRVFDDGHSTYFLFPKDVDFPAVFLTDGKKQETLVDTAVRDGFLVVDEIAPHFLLRRGKETSTITNDAFIPPAIGGLPKTPTKKAPR